MGPSFERVRACVCVCIVVVSGARLTSALGKWQAALSERKRIGLVEFGFRFRFGFRLVSSLGRELLLCFGLQIARAANAVLIG